MITNARRFPPTARAITALVLASLALAGCESLANGLSAAGMPIQDWQGVRKQPQPEAIPQSYLHTVIFPVDEGILLPIERRELSGFLAGLEVSNRDRVLIVSPQDGTPVAEQRVRAVGAALSAAGLRWTRAVDPSAAPDEVGVVVERVVVTLPACPNWTEMPNNSFRNQPTSNWGCSTAVDFGMMVAEPSDLNFGRVPGPSDGTVMSGSIERYRLGKTKPMIRDSGSSDVYPQSGN